MRGRNRTEGDREQRDEKELLTKVSQFLLVARLVRCGLGKWMMKWVNIGWVSLWSAVQNAASGWCRYYFMSLFTVRALRWNTLLGNTFWLFWGVLKGLNEVLWLKNIKNKQIYYWTASLLESLKSNYTILSVTTLTNYVINNKYKSLWWFKMFLMWIFCLEIGVFVHISADMFIYLQIDIYISITYLCSHHCRETGWYLEQLSWEYAKLSLLHDKCMNIKVFVLFCF